MPHCRRLALLLGLLLSTTSTLAPGCSLGGDGGADGPDRGDADAGAGPGFEDGGAHPPDGGLAPLDAGAGAPPSEHDGPDGEGCFDFRDGDGDGAIDCEDADCAGTPICCVGSSSEACCVDRAAEAHAFGPCSGTGAEALLACAPGVTLFGSPAPELFDGALLPNGGERFDSGIVLASTVDPRVSRVALEATIAAAEGCESCLDSVAVGLARTDQSLGATVLVDSDLALMVSAATGTVQLLVGGAVSNTTTLESVRALVGASERSALHYRLETTTSGEAFVTVAAEGRPVPVFTDVPFAPRGPARVVAWGRSANRGPGEPPLVRLERISVNESVCDAPAALARTSTPILPDALDGWWVPGESVSSPSVVAYDDPVTGERRARMAFVYQGRIHAASGIEGGRFRALADPGVPSNAQLAPGGAEWMAAGLDDPELVRAEDGRWQLWFTAVGADGRRSIGRADAAVPDELVLGAPTPVLVPDPSAGIVGWDSPSLVSATIDGTPRRFLAARQHRAGDASDETAIVLFELGAPGEAPSPAPTTVLDPATGEVLDRTGIVRAATGIPSDFDADEVAGPSLVAYGDVLRLYYAGRRGTRWSIGVLLSPDARHWHDGMGRAVLSGAGSGFDALSVSAPEPVVEGGELRLYYTGSDGVRASIGLARHVLPQDETAP